jgi:hypothetical protein
MPTPKHSLVLEPEDRVYHVEDQTWWESKSDGTYIKSDEPSDIKEIKDKLRQAKRLLLKIVSSNIYDTLDELEPRILLWLESVKSNI